MIKFGSRTELTLADWLGPEVKVTVGQRVRGASDVLAVLTRGIHTTAVGVSATDDAEPLVGPITPA